MVALRRFELRSGHIPVSLPLDDRCANLCHPFQRCTVSIEMVRTCGILNMDLYSLLNHFVVYHHRAVIIAHLF